MKSYAESQAIRDFLFENPIHLDVALAVQETWPSIRDTVCNEFLDQLCTRIREVESIQKCETSVQIGSVYKGAAAHSSRIWLYGDNWKPYVTSAKANLPPWGNRTAFVLEPDGKDLGYWFFNVQTPLSLDTMVATDRSRQEHLQQELSDGLGKSEGTTHNLRWPWWIYATPDMRHWNSLVPRLYRECKSSEGEITRYFVETFVSLALKAIPVIDQIEHTRSCST
ncbi:MAG: hypothetical protein OXG24_09550 [Gammaproteobacteria bacterium]|nr:hypothetical protein [Gammaproteobacteria bacterium]